MNTKQTILYERLSHEDGRENKSVSIENQKAYLEEYATRNGFTNLVHMADDGWSSTRWDRPAFVKMMDEVERGNVQNILIKDMSRLGRDHLRVGLFLEQLREMGVRLIAVAESIDTDKGEDDFMPFRNIIAEWHARDTSRKIKAIFGARTAQGKRVTGAVPYGYMHDPADRQQWLIDPETAPVVKRIFQSIINGKGVTQIADELTAEGILTPNAYWKSTGAKVSRGAQIVILKKEDYMGWKVLNKTAKDSYKSKKRQNTPENKLIFKDSHPAIIDEETWNVVQRENEAEFMKRVRQEADLQQEAAVKESRKKLTKSKRRREEVSGLIKKLYETYATGKIPENHFSELLKGYDTEQTTLDSEIEKLQAEIDRYNTDSVRADKFMELVKRHTEFNEFSAALLNEFIEKVIVHEADKSSGRREQKIDIYLNYIGKFELPEEEAPPEEIAYVRNSHKKLRRFMTPEELEHHREIDRRRYAKVRAEREAKKEAERSAILQGTAYEIPPPQSEVQKSA